MLDIKVTLESTTTITRLLHHIYAIVLSLGKVERQRKYPCNKVANSFTNHAFLVRQEHNRLTQNVSPSHCDRSQEPSKGRPPVLTAWWITC